jgi:Peptidase family M1 domain
MPARRLMPRSRHNWRTGRAIGTATAALAIVVPLASSAAAATSVPALAGAGALRSGCSAGTRTLSPPGAHVYPETGNGGYTSVHTDVYLVYDATTNMFLPGNQVALTDTATQCLSSFSLDFERTSANQSAGPDMSVSSVLVNGQPAAFTFAQPTYPGDPKGPNDPNPLAHEASQDNPVGGPGHNPLPPACAPELPNTSVGANSMNGTRCPANKLVITPATPIRDGATFTVTVAYTGRPGVHNDGDGTTEGWFRSDVPSGDGGFVTTEPVGTEDWMPLNDFPAAKPSYDFYDTVTKGRTVLANGELESRTANPPSAEFPGGSTSFHWHSPEGVASYLVEDSIGRFDLGTKVVNGIRFYEAQASSLSAAQKAANLKVMNLQPGITAFEAQFNGPYPFPSGGVVVGRPAASFEEEMQTMITFAGGTIDTDTLYHENMHQWWGDHVTEGGYTMTFYKEGLATLAEYFYHARTAEAKAGGPGTRAGQAAFQASLVAQFNRLYARTASFWTLAPSNPTPYSLFDTSETYSRPGAAYVALRQILGSQNFDDALQSIQRHYGGGSITEPRLEAGFAAWLPNRSAACQTRLGQFFQQWFDTAYPAGGGANRPQITGPGLAGPGFYGGACQR